MHIDLELELLIALKLCFAFALAAFIGYDRARSGHSAGIRTYAAVAMGAALFGTVADLINDPTSEARVIAAIIEGIGSLGAGIIFKDKDEKEAQGLTTAATVWATAGVGVSIGLDLYLIALLASLALYFLLSMHRYKWYARWRARLQKGGAKELTRIEQVKNEV